MRLQPCPGCLRHVRSDERSCPFCGIALSFEPAVGPSLVGRASRAAVFAGAVLTGACSASPPPQSPPPPPPDDTTGTVDTRFAKPPDDDQRRIDEAKTSGRIEGVVTNANTNRVAAGVQIVLRAAGMTQREAFTDGSGHYAFDGLPPGTYSLVWGDAHPRGGGQQSRTIQVNGDTQRADLAYAPYVRSHLPTPYGAPPARRRIV